MADWPSRIRSLRKRLGLTQAGLAEEIGAARRSVIDWEAGKRAPERMAQMAIAAVEAGIDANRPEVRARMSEAIRKALADPEVRARISEGRRKALADPEVRARISEGRLTATMERYGFADVAELEAWRAVKAKGFSAAEAARIVLRSRKAVAA